MKTISLKKRLFIERLKRHYKEYRRIGMPRISSFLERIYNSEDVIEEK